MLRIDDLTYRIEGRVLFDGACAAVAPGAKVGLVGRNGSGKTTLFGLIGGELSADCGNITVRRSAKLGRVLQEAPDGDASLLETVLGADVERASLLAEAETATDAHRIGDIHNRLADIDAYSAPSRAAAILSGLGFSEEAQRQPCTEFSGGWRMRVALAAALFAEPDFLLLDEPTNHLDLEAAIWLESYLAKWPGTLLVISHDRELLNKVVDGIIHLEGGKLTRYQGGYDRFEESRRERQKTQSKMRRRQIAQRRHIESYVDRFRFKATKARQAQSRLKMLARMKPIASVVEEKTPSFSFPACSPLAPPVIALDGAAVGYENDIPVIEGLDLRIDADDRIALLGVNGNGKSTLVKLLAGRLELMKGTMRRSSKLKVGYFAQHQSDELHAGETPFHHMSRALNETAPAKVRGCLGRFGFVQERADTQIRNLSGGEKSRLLLALMSAAKPHVLLLDEPTNHLDVDAREALVQALNDFEGAVILVSHDPHLIELVSERLWLVSNGTCVPYDGDLGDYRKLVLNGGRPGRLDGKASKNVEGRRERARARGKAASMKKTVGKFEKLLETLNSEKLGLEEKLADPAIYQGPAGALRDAQIKLAAVNDDLAETEQAWLEAYEAVELSG
jgi:ATP-binding cassette subfamily F protein 3